MKLIIQIPCFNEEQTLPLTLSHLPREMDGFDSIEWLIIDDGSIDNTVAVAKACGVDHIVSLPNNQGLAKAFMAGLDACLKQGADIIVNTDADNQYYAGDIANLVQPILAGQAQLVIGARPINNIQHFSPIKKLLQYIGSAVVRFASKTDIPDAPSGFRAIHRDTAIRLNVFNDYTYTLETIIQAGQKNMAIMSIPIRINKDERPSRLMKSITSYIKRSITTIVRIFVVYKPFEFFMGIGATLFSIGFLIGLRYLYFLQNGQGEGHVQSVILAGLFMSIGFQTGLIAFIADLLSVNRKLLEDIQYQTRSMNQPDSTTKH